MAGHRPTPRRGFTLVELLVVIGIIALLISILLPSLARARDSATTLKNLSNLRQLGVGLEFYKNDNKGFYPRHSSIAAETTGATPWQPRTRWFDDIFKYMQVTEAYLSPHLTDDELLRMRTPFAHTTAATGTMPNGILPTTKYFGGYGYNYQYLGNARKPGGIPPFHANATRIRAAVSTIAVADTEGSKNGGPAYTSEGVYSIDPPLMSIALGSQGSRRTSATPGPGQYGYTGGNDGDPSHRCTPAERNSRNSKVAVVFCDGHAETLTLEQLDDSNNDGVKDNGYWTGRGDPTPTVR